jgi:SAM-dependent methyltransferase
MNPSGLCKVCGYALFAEPLLRYPNMPGVAQHLPTAESARHDHGMDLDVYQCSGCGLVQLDVEPVAYFRETIRAVGVSAEMRAFRLRQFREFIVENHLVSRKMVEIGCGRGEYLSIMREAGADAFGLEWGEDAVKDCVAGGLPAARGFVESAGYAIPNGPFDGFAILSFLEHLPRPGEVLRGIHGNLNEGGVGMVEVPNFDMILRGHMFSEFMRDHLFYFTRRTLATTLEQNGFEVLDIREIWQEYILSAKVRKRGRMDLSAFAGHQAKLKDEIDAFLNVHAKVAIWGAGHQAFAVMALTGLAGRVRYVVDSAPFKQGKLTPVSHLPIVAPDRLQSDPVDAVLIMAGSYGDEIVKIVRQMADPRMKIAVLRDFGLEVMP